jgi:CBS domain-containing protein
LLVEHGISGLPVVDGDNLVLGVVSETDVLYKERRPLPKPSTFERLLGHNAGAKPEPKAAATVAGEAMTSPPVTIMATASVADAAGTMLDRGVNRLPVVDAQGQLLGIVTRADLVRAFVRPDEEIAIDIRELIAFQLWLDDGDFRVAVEHGAVEIEGPIPNVESGEVLERFVRRIPGVVSVETRLVVPAT